MNLFSLMTLATARCVEGPEICPDASSERPRTRATQTTKLLPAPREPLHQESSVSARKNLTESKRAAEGTLNWFDLCARKRHHQRGAPTGWAADLNPPA